MESKRLETAKKYIEQFGTNDIELLESILDETMVHEFSPMRSLDSARDLDKTGFMEFRKIMTLGLTRYLFDAKQYIESESSNSKCLLCGWPSSYWKIKRTATNKTTSLVVVIWAEGRPQFREEVKDYEAFTKEEWEGYVGEFVFMLTFNETGDKIIKVREFIDSKGTDNRFLPLTKKALEKLEKIQREAEK